MDKQTYLSLACKHKEPGLKKIIPSFKQANKALIYHNCPANVFTALKRNCLKITKPKQQAVDKFKKFVNKIMKKEIYPLLEQFKYDTGYWLNHLPHSKQKKIITMDRHALRRRRYEMFCKKEKQEITSSVKNPKNRCICGPNEEYKWVMGPPVHALEALFKKKFKGYTSGLNNKQKEKLLNDRRLKGLTKLIQGDGSGFDRTQYASLKNMCEKKIYRRLLKMGLITHVNPDDFRYQSQLDKVDVHAIHMSKEGKYFKKNNMGKATITGTTQSGDMDTTFGNTLRMCLYIRYIAEEGLGLTAEQYDLDVSGDDFALFVSQNVSDKLIRERFYQVFATANQDEHGLGQVLKFLKITGIEGYDFCSSECFWSETNQSYYITRKLDRFLTMTCYSQKALGMSIFEQRQYMLDLYDANNIWAHDLPIFSNYNNLLKRYAERLPSGKTKNKNGKSKLIFPVNKDDCILYDLERDTRLEKLTHQFSRDEAYSLVDRMTPIDNVRSDYYSYLFRRYNLSPQMVDDICLAIDKADPKSWEINCPSLEDLLSYKAKHDEHLNAGGVWFE